MSNTLRQKLKAADRWAENALIGAGHGITNQLEGLYQIGAHPVQFGKGMVALGRNALADPRAFGGAIRNALSGTASRAASGPLGFGEVVGENLPLNPSAYMRRVPAMRNITVYHGSPHDFAPEPGHPLGRPRMDKIGTGEGAQAYGHGLYVADRPGVARSYLPPLSNKEAADIIAQQIRASGPGAYGLRVVDDDVFPGQNLAPSHRWVNGERTDKLLRGTSVAAIRNGDINAALESLGIPTPFKNGFYFGPNVALVKGERPKRGVDYGEWTLKNSKVVSVFRKANSGSSPLTSGHLYTIDLPDEHIAKMLDWDAPLSEQPPKVRELFATAEGDPRRPLGQHLYKEMVKNAARGQMGRSFPSESAAAQFVSEELAKYGIPGIKYWDAGSREAGRGTRNYVVFDDKLLKILKRE